MPQASLRFMYPQLRHILVKYILETKITSLIMHESHKLFMYLIDYSWFSWIIDEDG